MDTEGLLSPSHGDSTSFSNAPTLADCHVPARGPASPLRSPPTSGFEIVDDNFLLEEQSYKHYQAELYYPVHIGEVFESRYQVIGKLGYGSVSTSWVCRDLEEHRYVTLKVYQLGTRQAQIEVNVYEHLKSVNQNHHGAKFVRKLLGSFEVSGKNGSHQCLIHETLVFTMNDFRMLFTTKKFSADLLRSTIYYLLQALSFLHGEAKIVHTDIQETNIMISGVTESMLKEFEDDEWSSPCPRKINGNMITYASRSLGIPPIAGDLILCDMGEARFGKDNYCEEAMPDLYRAPEIILQIPWAEKIDIWSVGMVAWELLEGKALFQVNYPSREETRGVHLARMIALLGPPPKDLLDRGELAEDYFDENGNYKGDVPIVATSLEEEEEALRGEEEEERELFLTFMRKMLQWRPEDRSSALDLIMDPWLLKNQPLLAKED